MRAKKPSQKDPQGLAFTVGRRFQGAMGGSQSKGAMEEHEGGTKQDEYWALSFGFSSAVGTDLGEQASGSRGGGSRAAGGCRASGRLSVVWSDWEQGLNLEG